MKKKLLIILGVLQTLVLAAQIRDFKVVKLTATDLVFAPKRQVLYASVPSNISNYGNSICRINPNTGVIETSVWAGSEPVTLALSEDEKYLYVGFNGTPRVKRLNLTTNLFDQEIFLGYQGKQRPYNFTPYAHTIAVLPDKSDSYIISKSNNIYSISFEGVDVYDGINRRAKSVTTDSFRQFGGNGIFFGQDSTTLWGLGQDQYYNDDTWYKMKVDGSGVQPVASFKGFSHYNNLAFSPFDSLFYSGNGGVFDVRSGTPIGRTVFNTQGYTVPAIDNSDLYVLPFSATPQNIMLQKFNRITGRLLEEYNIPVGFGAYYIKKAVNWGASGKMAILFDSSLVILNPCVSKAPKPFIVEGTHLKACPGKIITLTATPTAKRYYWSTGDTMQSIQATGTFDYRVGIADSTGCVNYSGPTTVETLPTPSTPYIQASNAFCPGSVVRATASTFDGNVTFLWSTGQTTQSIDITQPTTLTVTATSIDGCASAPSLPSPITFMDLPLPPKPVIQITGDTSICAGERIKLTGPAGYYQYQWTSSFENTRSIYITPSNMQAYILKVGDYNGCISVASDTITFKVRGDAYSPSIFQNGAVLTGTVSVKGAYQWFLNGQPIAGANQLTYTPTESGFYYLQSTVDGCPPKSSQLINATVVTAVRQLAQGQKFDVFPNPSDGELHIHTEGLNQSSIFVTDWLGRTVFIQSMQETDTIIPLQHFAGGLYCVYLKNEHGQILSVKKIIKL